MAISTGLRSEKLAVVEEDMTAALRKQLRPALDAIIRWLKAPPVAEDVSPVKAVCPDS
jgi:hypothetical protein